MNYKEWEKSNRPHCRSSDSKLFDLPALLVWLFVLAAFAFICWVFFDTATAPK